MKLLITILMLIITNQSFALDAFYLPYTKHFTDRSIVQKHLKYNEKNHVIGATSDKYAAFVMNNSYNKFGVFAGRKVSLEITPFITSFAVAGIVTGYGNVMDTYKGIGAMAYVGLDIHSKDSKFGFLITGLPVKKGAINIGFRYSL